jgi:Zn-dependent protease
MALASHLRRRMRRVLGSGRLHLWRRGLLLAAGRRIELAVHLGWLVTVLAITWLLAQLALPIAFPGWDATAYWWVAAWIALADSLAGLLHELGHAAASLAQGGRVYRITLYGLAAAGRRSSSPQGPREQLWIALAGPLSHIVLAVLFWGVWRLAPEDNLPLRVAAAFPAVSNTLLGILNLLPLRPLDGRRVLASATRLVALKRGRPLRKLRIVGTPKRSDVWPSERTRAA